MDLCILEQASVSSRSRLVMRMSSPEHSIASELSGIVFSFLEFYFPLICEFWSLRRPQIHNPGHIPTSLCSARSRQKVATGAIEAAKPLCKPRDASGVSLATQTDSGGWARHFPAQNVDVFEYPGASSAMIHSHVSGASIQFSNLK